jgi:hypothetical protein
MLHSMVVLSVEASAALVEPASTAASQQQRLLLLQLLMVLMTLLLLQLSTWRSSIWRKVSAVAIQLQLQQGSSKRWSQMMHSHMMLHQHRVLVLVHLLQITQQHLAHKPTVASLLCIASRLAAV